MQTWHIHTAHDSLILNQDELEVVGEQLEQYDAAVSAHESRVHVDLTVQAPTAIDAATLALAAVQRTSLRTRELLQVEATRDDEAQRLLDQPTLPEVAGGKEVAELLGVSKQRVHQLLQREDFPDPVIRLASGPIWTVASIRSFERQWHRRGGRPAHATAARLE